MGQSCRLCRFVTKRIHVSGKVDTSLGQPQTKGNFGLPLCSCRVSPSKIAIFGDGVTVAQKFLVLLVQVRILIPESFTQPHSEMPMTLSAIILAAGKATRMKSPMVKVLHEICGRPMLAYVLDACRAVGVQRMYVVVGHDRERVMRTFADAKDITWVTQEEQKGTGHACLVCRDAFNLPAELTGKEELGHTFVLCGDGPLIRAQTLQELLDKHQAAQAGVTLATSILSNPAGYGRIVRDTAGKVTGIVEQNDATDAQKQICEVNPSYYLYRTADLFASLAQVKPNNKKGEYYLTDTLAIIRNSGKVVEALPAVPPEDVLSINSRADLAAVNRVMQQRIQAEVMASGVTIVSPENTWIEFGAKIGEDVVLCPFTWVGTGAVVPANTTLAAGSVLKRPGGA